MRVQKQRSTERKAGLHLCFPLNLFELDEELLSGSWDLPPSAISPRHAIQIPGSVRGARDHA